MSDLVLFDIDNTLFDTDTYRNLITTSLVKTLGVTRSQYASASETYFQTLPTMIAFEPRKLIKHLAQHFSRDFNELWQASFGNPHHYRNSYYPESLPTLEFFQDKYILGIFSEGNLEFQKAKIEHIQNYFHPDHQYIYPNKTRTHVFSQLPQSVIIDDNPRVIESLLPQPHLTPIWINRKSDDINPHVQTIHKLEHLHKLI